MTDADKAIKPFTLEASRAALAEACNAIGVRAEGAELIRLGENAIYRVPEGNLVVRIARGIDVLPDARKEVAVSRWLHSTHLPVAQTTKHQQPIVADGRPVTFWRFIESTGEEATVAELGAVLRQLHSLAPPAGLDLPPLDMFGRVDVRIDRASDIPEADRSFLRERVKALRKAYADLRFPLKRCAVHGDAHTANLMPTPDGDSVLIDFERFAFGQPEIDLAVTAVEHRIGWYTDSEYSSFVQAYGFDVTDWDGFSIVQAISELKMTTWIMQNASHSPEITAEVRVRLEALRDPTMARHWKPF
ncbi:MAG TPA: aminoglycoside phosphotransferase family protein [Actinocrinis sp.]|uniref:phosphotransferase family protein n=1 Tax=Actinocrinis sp. TaxID=1920516 RepID=UPI002DDCFA5A|nr:aminoglycoside phosphotransferase family protein [Actinocrinis sp.]HEV2344720.1 aminoglycoside phosphotransferase family protein [Actinocrinis sp.]